MDYAKFINKRDEGVFAYLGGPYAYGRERRVRVDEPRPSLGFHRFEIKGRKAKVIGGVEAPALDGLARVCGHHVRGWVVASELALRAEHLQLLPAEEPMPFAIVRARRWHSGDLVFESLDFDSEVEDTARRRLEEKGPLGDAKGVPATLRLAYGVALASVFATEMNIPLGVREAIPVAARIADEGEGAARPFLVALDGWRREEHDRARIRAILAGQQHAAAVVAYRTPARDVPTRENTAERAEAALDAARARMVGFRHLGDGQVEVTFTFMGERFISVVDAITLQVYDSGVCLAGADDLVTLDSLPGVIREAIEEGLLVITRR